MEGRFHRDCRWHQRYNTAMSEQRLTAFVFKFMLSLLAILLLGQLEVDLQIEWSSGLTLKIQHPTHPSLEE